MALRVNYIKSGLLSASSLPANQNLNIYSMPPQLLPASAAAFKPRASSVHVVLGPKVEPWVTHILRHVAHVKRLGKSVQEHQRCLTEILSSPDAIWILTSIVMPKAPDTDLRKDSNPLVEALFNYRTIHIEGYIVHVDLVLQNEVAFKLTPDSIESLIEYHREVHCVNIPASNYKESQRELQAKELHKEFVQAINRFVYITPTSALEGLDNDGSGELLCGKSKEVKDKIMALLLISPSQVADVAQRPSKSPTFLVVNKSHMIPNATSRLKVEIPRIPPYDIECPLDIQLASVSSEEVYSILPQRSSPDAMLLLPSMLIIPQLHISHYYFGGQTPILCEAV